MMWHIWRSWLPLFCIGDCDAKMVAVLVIFTAFLAVLIAAILRMYFNQLVPEGLPVDQHHKLRIVGLITKLTGMVVSLFQKYTVTFLFEVAISLLWFYNYFINPFVPGDFAEKRVLKLVAFSPPFFFRFSCLIFFFSCWAFSRLHFGGKSF